MHAHIHTDNIALTCFVLMKNTINTQINDTIVLCSMSLLAAKSTKTERNYTEFIFQCQTEEKKSLK